MSNEIQTSNAQITKIKGYLANESVQARLKDMLGKQAGAFTNSIINVARTSTALVKCTPESIVSSAMVAATLNLPIDPALGQAAIVPYGSEAHFQIMYKGVTQLCIRSGLYETIHCTAVYRDELESWNPLTGEIDFTDPSTWKLREKAKDSDVVGHYARLKLLAGFQKCDFMTVKEVMAHAEKYSKAYQYDLQQKKRSSRWSIDPVAMGNKTVLLRLLGKYGVMSIEMRKAFVEDSVDFADTQIKAEARIEAESGSEVIDIDPEPSEDAKPKRGRAKLNAAKKEEENINDFLKD